MYIKEDTMNEVKYKAQTQIFVNEDHRFQRKNKGPILLPRAWEKHLSCIKRKKTDLDDKRQHYPIMPSVTSSFEFSEYVFLDPSLAALFNHAKDSNLLTGTFTCDDKGLKTVKHPFSRVSITSSLHKMKMFSNFKE